jgi:iron complex outermembrane receptor protein
MTIHNTAIAKDTVLSDLTEMPLDQLLQTEVITASKIAQQITDASSSVSIVTAEDIQAYGYRTLAEVLESMRGLYITDDKSYAFLGGRGYGRPGDFTGRILLVIDGIAVNENVYGSSALDHSGLIDVDLIERVEYVAGPGTAINSHNAFFGVINVTTKTGEQIDGVQTSVEVGSYDSKKIRVTYGEKLENDMNLMLSASGLESDGQNYFFPEAVDPAESIDGHAYDLDGQTNQRVFGKLNWETGGIQAMYVNRDKDIPTAPYGADFNTPYNYDDTSFNLGVEQNFELNQDVKLSVNAYYGYYRYEGISIFDGDPWPDSSRGQWAGINAQFSNSAIANHQLVYGAEYKNNFEQTVETPDAQSTHRDQIMSVFAQDEYALNDKFSLSGGLRYEYSNQISKAKLNPRAAIIYHQSDATILKLSYSRTHRFANPYEKYYTDTEFLLGNEDVKPEQIDAYELVAEHDFADQSRLLASIYYYKTDDFISSVDIGSDQTQFQNTSGNETKGVELEYEKHWDSGIRLRTSYAYQLAVSDDDTWQVNSPRHIGKFNLTTPIFNYKWHAGIETLAYSQRKTEFDTYTGGYGLTNLTLNYDRLMSDLSITIGVRNVFDKDYQHVAPETNTYQTVIPQNDRNYFIQLEYDFK